MFGKLKLAMAASIVLIGGAAGLAMARDGRPDRGALKEKDHDGPRAGGWRHHGKLDGADRADRKERRAKMIAKFDANGDGKLDDAERAAMQKSRKAEMFARLDKNGDGVLSLDEFAAGGGRGHGRHGKRR